MLDSARNTLHVYSQESWSQTPACACGWDEVPLIWCCMRAQKVRNLWMKSSFFLVWMNMLQRHNLQCFNYVDLEQHAYVVEAILLQKKDLPWTVSVSLLCKSTTTAENIQLLFIKKQKRKQKNTIVHGIRLVKVSSYP